MKYYFVLFLLLLPFVSAQYYADITIDVSESGLVSIDGSTNNNNLQVDKSPYFTDKHGPYWLLNITVEETFDDYIYELNLPDGAVINYLKTQELLRIEDGPKIVGSGSDSQFVVVVQYSINRTNKHLWWIFIFPFILLILYFARRKKNVYDLSNLTDRQKQIFKIIKDAKKPVTQKYIEEKTGLPKSSVSRNVSSLETKDFINRKTVGMSKLIEIKH